MKLINYNRKWVATEIVLTSNAKERLSVIKRFIEIAQYLREIDNFNSLIELVAGLKVPFSSYNFYSFILQFLFNINRATILTKHTIANKIIKEDVGLSTKALFDPF